MHNDQSTFEAQPMVGVVTANLPVNRLLIPVYRQMKELEKKTGMVQGVHFTFLLLKKLTMISVMSHTVRRGVVVEVPGELR